VAERRVQSFRDLDAWQLGLSLAVAIDGVVKHLPQSEQFGLSSQMRRAASQGRPTMRKDKRAAKTAVASIIFEWQLGLLGELSTQVEIAAPFGHVGVRARIGNRGARWQNRPSAPRTAPIQTAEAASEVSGIRASLLHPLV
jgi:hypothetical protein